MISTGDIIAIVIFVLAFAVIAFAMYMLFSIGNSFFDGVNEILGIKKEEKKKKKKNPWSLW